VPTIAASRSSSNPTSELDGLRGGLRVGGNERFCVRQLRRVDQTLDEVEVARFPSRQGVMSFDRGATDGKCGDGAGELTLVRGF
jgi:hypothetical protein